MIALLSQNDAFVDYCSALLEEAGLPLTKDNQTATLVVVDLDTMPPPQTAQEKITVSSDLFADADLVRPFLSSHLLALCRQKLFGKAVGAEPLSLVLPSFTPKEKTEACDIVLLEDSVTAFGEEVLLTPCEYRLFALLLNKRGQAVSQKECAEVLGASADEGNLPSVYINHLRKKFDYRFTKRMIVTVRGKGYMLLPKA